MHIQTNLFIIYVFIMKVIMNVPKFLQHKIRKKNEFKEQKQHYHYSITQYFVCAEHLSVCLIWGTV